jgi:predicted nucleic acid-binding protein
MPHLIDTNWIIHYLAGHPTAVNLLNTLVPQGIEISIITYPKLYEGTLRHANPRQTQAQLQAFLTTVPLFPLTLAVARRCAHLREDLRRRGRRVRPRALDLIIAATALEHNLTLVTRNRADFQDVPDLRLY